MIAIFHDMIEESMEVFMDDFSVFGDSFKSCLVNLDKMLRRCEEANLVLNWEKCHFMVKEGIVLGHKVSGAGLEVDKAKIDVIAKLPPSTNIKVIRSFLGHAGFYKRFIVTPFVYLQVKMWFGLWTNGVLNTYQTHKTNNKTKSTPIINSILSKIYVQTCSIIYHPSFTHYFALQFIVILKL